MRHTVLDTYKDNDIEIQTMTFDGGGNLIAVNDTKIAKGNKSTSSKNTVKDRILTAIAAKLAHSANFATFEKAKSIIVNQNQNAFEVAVTAKKDRITAPGKDIPPQDVTVAGIRNYIFEGVAAMPDVKLLGSETNRVYIEMPCGDFEIRVIKKRGA